MKKLEVLYIVVHLFWSSVFGDNDQLQLVQLVYRHGDRSPIELYPNDPNDICRFPEGLGQLTSVGKRQHFMLGEALRNRYRNFITGSPREVKVRSSDVNRCLESAQCNLAGMFPPPPNSTWKWKKYFNWQPIPIHTVPADMDYVLNTDNKCSVADKIKEELWKSQNGQEIMTQYKDVFDAVNNVTGHEATPNYVERLADTVKIELLKGLQIHPKLKMLKDKLVRFIDVLFKFECSSRSLQRIRSGLLLNSTLKNMEDKIANNINEKVFVYSTHDYVLGMFLNALGAYSGVEPPYAATVIIELHKNNKEYTISFFQVNNVAVSNKTIDIKFTPLEVHGCSSKCSLSTFKNDILYFIDFDPVKDCSAITEEETDFKIPLFILAAFICFFIAFFTVFALTRRKHKIYGIKYEPVPTN